MAKRFIVRSPSYGKAIADRPACSRELYDIPVIPTRNCRDFVARVRPLQIAPRVPILLPPFREGYDDRTPRCHCDCRDSGGACAGCRRRECQGGRWFLRWQPGREDLLRATLDSNRAQCGRADATHAHPAGQNEHRWTTAARPGLFGGGLLGGLAAGFLGAGLFGLLFGHGFFGGMGGFASLIGLVLQIVLVVIVARLLFAWWQRRNAPAPAYANAAANDRSFLQRPRRNVWSECTNKPEGDDRKIRLRRLRAPA